MNLNAAIVSGKDPINGRPMIDPLDQNSPLPMDVTRIILQNSKGNLDAIALVCRSWKALADNNEFREMIRPVQAFGTKEWKDYIGVDAEAEPTLPRRAYGDLEKEGGFLTFIPDKVRVAKENGAVEEVPLDNLEAIGNLVKKPKTDLKTGYNGDSEQEALGEKRILEKPHWVWIKKEVLGRNKTHEQHQELAREENAKIQGANISGLIDTAITVFMDYVRSGGRRFIWNPVKEVHTYVRLNDPMDRCFNQGWHLTLGFTTSGLLVYHNVCGDNEYIGFLCARKFFAS